MRPVHRSSADAPRSNAGGVLADNAKTRATGLLDAQALADGLVVFAVLKLAA